MIITYPHTLNTFQHYPVKPPCFSYWQVLEQKNSQNTVKT